MTSAKKNYLNNIESIYELDNIYTFLENQVTAIDISVMLRAEYVLIVSALDNYIHEVVRNGLLERFENPSLSKGMGIISIPLNIVKLLLTEANENQKKQILNSEIKKITSKDSYQSPKGIEFALALIDIKGIWNSISDYMLMKPNDIKDTLSLIVNRRNKIAHEADMDYLTLQKTPIDRETVIDCLGFIKKLVDSIDQLVIVL